MFKLVKLREISVAVSSGPGYLTPGLAGFLAPGKILGRYGDQEINRGSMILRVPPVNWFNLFQILIFLDLLQPFYRGFAYKIAKVAT